MRVFLKKPKWLAYLLLLIMVAPIVSSVFRYYLGSRAWVTYENNKYGFAIDHPGNWSVESYPGWYYGREGVVAIISDSPGIVEASTILIIYWRPAVQPSLSEAAEWGRMITSEEGGHSYSSLELSRIGPNSLPASQQKLRYGENTVGLSVYIAGSDAEYILAFRSQDGSVGSVESFEHMLLTFDLIDLPARTTD